MIGFIILILNGTRMAMLSLVIAGGLYYVKTSFNVKSIIQFVVRLLGYGALFVIMIAIAMQFDRFKSLILILTDLIKFNLKFSEDTASLFARLHLYQVSLNMIGEHWILGIGPGRWNFLKYDYGFSEIGILLINVLLDPHNDYLSYLSQYGIFGLLFIGLILFFPTIQFLKNSDNPFVYFGLIPFTLIFSGMTNSNTLKHNIFALSSLIVLLVSQIWLNNNSFNKIEET
jgi:O-antigen ligase